MPADRNTRSVTRGQRATRSSDARRVLDARREECQDSHNPDNHTSARNHRAQPYPSWENVFARSNVAFADEDGFDDLYLKDMVMARKRIGRRALSQLDMAPGLYSLLHRGLKHQMDRGERERNIAVETCMGYSASLALYNLRESIRINEEASVFR